MATLDGIRCPIPTQPASSSKLRIYESLFLLNQSIDQVLTVLRRMAKFPFADKESLQCAQAEIEEVRCDMNADFAGHLADSERLDEGRFWKQRREFEKKWRDPDDVYIDVQRREEERKKQGLPPRVGIVPHSAIAEEEKRREAAEERKKKGTPQRQKPAPQAKNTVAERRHD